MTSASSLECPLCSHESDDGAAFRTHLLVEHRKSDVVDYVLEDRLERATEGDAAEPVAH